MGEIAGIVISGGVALTLLLAGLFGLLSKGSIGQSVRSVFAMIPIGNPKLWSAIILVIGLIAGGFGFGQGLVSGLFGMGTVASITSENAVNVGGPQLANCQITTISTTAATTGGNTTLRADPNDLTHYYIDLKNTTNAGAASINGTITCDRVIDNIRIGQTASCQIVSDSFRSQTSTTDANTYYFVATSTSKSAISGFPWAQTAYLNDGAVATTSSRREVTPYTFAQDTVSKSLGFYFTLPGATTMNYLNDNNGGDITVSCDGNKVAKFTITKLSNQVL
jgi:hypothetical protein